MGKRQPIIYIIEEMVSTNRNIGVYVGEQDPEELAECLLDPQTRNVKQIVVSDYRETDKLFDILMGTSVPPRREFLLEHSEEANIL